MLDNTTVMLDEQGDLHGTIPSNSHDLSNDVAADGVNHDAKDDFLGDLSTFQFSPSEFLNPSMNMFEPDKGLNFLAAPFAPSPAPEYVAFDTSFPELGLQSPTTTFTRRSPSAHLGLSDHTARLSHTISPSELNRHKTNLCDCFAACVQILQSLHNHSCRLAPAQHKEGLSFDVVLNSNKDAIESCASLLACTKCVSECGKSVVNMLLATVLGKVISLYRAICLLMFGSSNSLQDTAQLAFGAYKVTGTNRQLLEIEILLLDLRKVRGVLMSYSDRFSEGCPSKDDDNHVYETLKTYLENNLRNLVQYLNAQKSNVSKS